MTEEQPNFEVVSGDEVLRRYKEAGITAQPVEFDEAEVPALLRRLTPLAREWGIGDDVLREHEVRTTSAEVLADVARAVREVEDELLAWLTSDAALSEARPQPTLHSPTCCWLRTPRPENATSDRHRHVRLVDRGVSR